MVGPTNQAMLSLIAADPDAYWDSLTQSVQGSSFLISPRVLFVAAFDPRLPAVFASSQVTVRKVLVFFAERMEGSAIVRGRLTRVQFQGETCDGASAGGFVVECPVPATPASWGEVKHTYR
jgi:hypothetical protein